jgi:hypothetical protein
MDDQALDVVFRVPADGVRKVLAGLGEDPTLRPEEIRPAGATGGGDLVTILVAVGAAAIPVVAKVIIELGKLRRASVEVDGIRVTGISRNVAEDILRQHFDRKQRTKKKQE